MCRRLPFTLRYYGSGLISLAPLRRRCRLLRGSALCLDWVALLRVTGRSILMMIDEWVVVVDDFVGCQSKSNCQKGPFGCPHNNKEEAKAAKRRKKKKSSRQKKEKRLFVKSTLSLHLNVCTFEGGKPNIFLLDFSNEPFTYVE